MISALMLGFALQSAAPLPTPQSLRAIDVRAPHATLHLQVAFSEAQRERGLMGVMRLPPRTGMVFVFEKDGPVAFWMKDTPVALDMIFVSRSGVVRKIFSGVPVVPLWLPDTDIPLERGEGKYVIELPAFEARADGLRVGSVLHGLP
ncbi:MAG: DUF192 domain-containing protein [Candidatus Baltobacteraceae bacterium]